MGGSAMWPSPISFTNGSAVFPAKINRKIKLNGFDLLTLIRSRSVLCHSCEWSFCDFLASNLNLD